VALTATVARRQRAIDEGDRGLFVTFEGGEGAGKSAQAAAIAGRLEARGCGAVCTREPGGTALGERLRDILLGLSDDLHEPDPLTETILFAAARAELVASVILPALTLGETVLCDRFADSTVAYQGYGRGVDLELIEEINAVATRGLRPNLTVLLDLPAREGLARAAPGGLHDRFEQEDLAFHERVRAGYLELAAREPGRWLVVDAALPFEVVTERIWARLAALLDASE
jgi:dTMP kinase